MSGFKATSNDEADEVHRLTAAIISQMRQETESPYTALQAAMCASLQILDALGKTTYTIGARDSEVGERIRVTISVTPSDEVAQEN